MAKRAKPAWGNLGVICLKGYGQTDDQLNERGIVSGEHGRGDRGFLLSDAQFDRLATHLNLTDPNQKMEARARLDSIRRFYLKKPPLRSGYTDPGGMQCGTGHREGSHWRVLRRS